MSLVSRVGKDETKGEVTEAGTGERLECSRSDRLGYSNGSTRGSQERLRVAASVLLLIAAAAAACQSQKTGCS